MAMWHSIEKFFWAFTDSFWLSTTNKPTMVEKKLKKFEIVASQDFPKKKVGPKPAV